MKKENTAQNTINFLHLNTMMLLIFLFVLASCSKQSEFINASYNIDNNCIEVITNSSKPIGANVWTANNGQDELKWHEFVNDNQGQRICLIDLKDHNNESGQYIIDVCVDRNSTYKRLVVTVNDSDKIFKKNVDKENKKITIMYDNKPQHKDLEFIVTDSIVDVLKKRSIHPELDKEMNIYIVNIDYSEIDTEDEIYVFVTKQENGEKKILYYFLIEV